MGGCVTTQFIFHFLTSHDCFSHDSVYLTSVLLGPRPTFSLLIVPVTHCSVLPIVHVTSVVHVTYCSCDVHCSSDIYCSCDTIVLVYYKVRLAR